MAIILNKFANISKEQINSTTIFDGYVKFLYTVYDEPFTVDSSFLRIYYGNTGNEYTDLFVTQEFYDLGIDLKQLSSDLTEYHGLNKQDYYIHTVHDETIGSVGGGYRIFEMGKKLEW